MPGKDLRIVSLTTLLIMKYTIPQHHELQDVRLEMKYLTVFLRQLPREVTQSPSQEVQPGLMLLQ
jgi:hypothetical protein